MSAPQERLNAKRVVRRDTNDSGLNGAKYGALIGTGAATAFLALAHAGCGAHCDAPGIGPQVVFVGVGTGIGAGVGFLVDKLRRGSEEVYRRAPRASVTPIVAQGHKGIVAAITF